MKSVFVTRRIPGPGIALLESKGFEVHVSKKEGVLSKEELIAELKAHPYEAVLSLLTDKIDAEVMDSATQLKIIANYAVGFDNISLPDARSRNIVVSNTPGALTNSVAEHAAGLTLTLAKRIVEADAFTKQGKYAGWDPMLFLGEELRGKVVGVLGLGRIGMRYAEIMARGFGMKVVYYDVARNETLEKELGAEYRANPEGVLQEADVVSVHVPLLETTRHLINRQRLALMKKKAFLINTSRGPVVEEAALVSALKEGIIAGAALDVFEFEPHLAEGLAGLSTVVLTPHIASATEEARAEMSKIAAENITAVFEGRTPPNPVL